MNRKAGLWASGLLSLTFITGCGTTQIKPDGDVGPHETYQHSHSSLNGMGGADNDRHEHFNPVDGRNLYDLFDHNRRVHSHPPGQGHQGPKNTETIFNQRREPEEP